MAGMSSMAASSGLGFRDNPEEENVQPPETSTTLLRALGADARSARWGGFVERYEPMMRAFLAAHFPSVPADDILQETLVAMVRAMPTYVYSPREHGHFRN